MPHGHSTYIVKPLVFDCSLVKSNQRMVVCLRYMIYSYHLIIFFTIYWNNITAMDPYLWITPWSQPTNVSACKATLEKQANVLTDNYTPRRNCQFTLKIHKEIYNDICIVCILLSTLKSAGRCNTYYPHKM